MECVTGKNGRNEERCADVNLGEYLLQRIGDTVRINLSAAFTHLMGQQFVNANLHTGIWKRFCVETS
jgi:hypothetical protein